MRREKLSLIVCALLVSFVAGGAALRTAQAAPQDEKAQASGEKAANDVTLPYQALQWRLVGPFRGGRATCITGIPSQPLVYYMGATGGGVWKTEDGGITWHNVSDGFMMTGSVGAIAVAGDDPNLIYVGMGEAPVRGQSSSFGDGMYKSTDAGKTWAHIGLENTRTISKVVVHPRNEDLVYVAAQGSRWAPTEERGVYRSTDGGKSWKKILFVDPSAGPSDLAMDPSNPRILYAAFWDHQRTPWQIRSGGPHSGIWKTTDGGDNWTRLTEGLPKLMGKIGISVSPANPDRIYANIEADDGGMYRSDDAGKTWHRTSDDRVIRARAWYYTVVTADPKSADVVYVINAPIEKSIDGGKTFTTLPGPHGDNHALWINPNNPLNMANANDGGADVTFDGGKSWSTQMNQPTAQFYRVEVDDLFPYQLYGGQQDNTTVVIKSRSFGPGIEQSDWTIQAGCESAHFAFDPKDPHYTYATCYQGQIEEFDTKTGVSRNVQEWPALGLGEPSNLQKYRYNWSNPVTTSPFDRKVLYHGGNVLFKSSDRGNTWTPISPDLTRNEKAHQGLGGVPITNEGAGGEVYNTIYYIAPSPHDAGTIWVGTDDGLVQLTRDGGKTWSNVSPKGLAEGLVNEIEVSPFDAGTAYVAFTRFKWNDNTPHIFKTTDYGKSWMDIAGGLPQDMPMRVVREDAKRKGLLFAGTENAAWFSRDDGAHWQTLQLNLPRVPVTDLKVHEGDLVASTEGRAFWILDDITPLEQLNDQVAKSDLYLFKPRRTYRIAGGGFSIPSGPTGKNPPNGAILRYILGAKPEESRELKLEILNSSGAVLRSYSSKAKPQPPMPGAEPGESGPPPLPTKKGMNQCVWDLRSEPPVRVPGILTQGPPEGYRVPSGTYTARLTLNGKTVTQTFEVANDPREIQSDADQQRQVAMAKAVSERINEINQTAIDLRSVRDQLSALSEHATGHSDASVIQKDAKAIVDQIDSLEEKLVQPKQKTFQDVINFRNGIAAQYGYLQNAVEGDGGPVTTGEEQRFPDLEKQWADLREQVRAVLSDVASFNAKMKSMGIGAILMPSKMP
ncbi:MAG: hypothetical protein WAN10_00915 [Candidatus Acidiferrales bacterium]